MIKQPIKLTLIIAIFGLIIACEHKERPGFDNILDNRNPEFEYPNIDLYETDIETQNHSYEFYWNNTDPENIIQHNTYYSYKLEGYDTSYCEWTKDNEANYRYLDDGDYVFNLKVKLGQGEKDEPLTAKLKVNALGNNSIYLRPMNQFVENGVEGYVDLHIKNVSDLKGLTTQLKFPSTFEVTKIEKAEEILIEQSTGLMFLTNSIDEINNIRRIVIDAVLLGTKNFGFTGSAKICRIYFKNSAPSDIEFDENKTFMRDFENQDIWIQQFRGSTVVSNN